MSLQDENHLNSTIEQLIAAIDAEDWSHLEIILCEDLSSAEIAHTLESSTSKVRKVVWEHLPAPLQGEVLTYLNEDMQALYLKELSPAQIADRIQEIENDDIADVLQVLPDSVTDRVLARIDPIDRAEVEELLAFHEDSAGGLMDKEFIQIRADVDIDVVFRYLRRLGSLPQNTDALYVINRNQEYIGSLFLTDLILAAPDASVREVMKSEVEAIRVDRPADEVAQLFERHDFVSAPVVNHEGRLVGRITIDDVVDVIRESADHSLMSMAGLDEDEDTFAPVWQSAKRRAIWLGINLLTAFLASMVAKSFELTLDQIVALAVIMNIAPSMGGIAGSQSLTLVIRAQALGHLNSRNLSWLVNREFGVGVLNGILWSVVIAVGSGLWFRDVLLAICVGAAILLNLVIAGLAGALLPVVLKKMNIDPALSGSVILTTITDVVGYVAFLGLATVIML